jgi:hypothetical protein
MGTSLSRRALMRNGLRLVALVAVIAVALGGPLAPVAVAQQPMTADLVPERLAETPRERGIDAYDVGAGVITVLKAPFNVGLCVLGTALGLTLFGLTLGSGYQASTRVVEEGCATKWRVTGDDIRPRHVGDYTDHPASARR